MELQENDVLINPEQAASLEAVKHFLEVRGIKFPRELFLELMYETEHLPPGPDPLKQRTVIQFAKELKDSGLTELADTLCLALMNSGGSTDEPGENLKGVE